MLEQNVFPQTLHRYRGRLPRFRGMNEWRMMFSLPGWPCESQREFGQDRSRTGLRIRSEPFAISVVARKRHKSYHHRHLIARQRQFPAEAPYPPSQDWRRTMKMRGCVCLAALATLVLAEVHFFAFSKKPLDTRNPMLPINHEILRFKLGYYYG